MFLSSLTLLLLAVVGVALLLLRSRWSTFTHTRRRSFLLGACAAILLFLLGRISGWTTCSDRLNYGVYWAAIVGYLFLLTVLSLNRPRWIASGSALILAIPVLGASIFLPLGGVFNPAPRRIQALGDHLYVSWQEFSDRDTASSGVDLEVLSRPRLLPFMQHTRLAGRFYNQRCHASATAVVLQPDGNTVFVRCPPWTTSGAVNGGDLVRLH